MLTCLVGVQKVKAEEDVKQNRSDRVEKVKVFNSRWKTDYL